MDENSLKGLSKEEIVAVFEDYDFRDAIGHKLTMCVRFWQLLDLAIAPPE